MISRRWLVQSGAIGVFGAAVFAIPFWMGLPAPPESNASPADSKMAVTGEGDGGDEVAMTTLTVRSLEADEVNQSPEDATVTTRTIRIRTVPHRVDDGYQGPMCPAYVAPPVPEYLLETSEH